MYEVTFSRTGLGEEGVNATGSPAPTSVNVSDLVTGSSYVFFVRAVNSIGSSEKSEGSDEVGVLPKISRVNAKQKNAGQCGRC